MTQDRTPSAEALEVARRWENTASTVDPTVKKLARLFDAYAAQVSAAAVKALVAVLRRIEAALDRRANCPSGIERWGPLLTEVRAVLDGNRHVLDYEIAAAVEAMQERCAQLCDQFAKEAPGNRTSTLDRAIEEAMTAGFEMAARAIRALTDDTAPQAAQDHVPPEDPTPEMIERGQRVAHATGAELSAAQVHDIWQAMNDEWRAGSSTEG